MTAPNWKDRTVDFTGINLVTKFTHVRITNKIHRYFGECGTVVRVEHPKVWVALPGGRVIGVSHRSLVRIAH